MPDQLPPKPPETEQKKVYILFKRPKPLAAPAAPETPACDTQADVLRSRTESLDR